MVMMINKEGKLVEVLTRLCFKMMMQGYRIIRGVGHEL